MSHVTFLKFIYTSFAELWQRGPNPQIEMHRVSKVLSTNDGNKKRERTKEKEKGSSSFKIPN